MRGVRRARQRRTSSSLCLACLAALSSPIGVARAVPRRVCTRGKHALRVLGTTPFSGDDAFYDYEPLGQGHREAYLREGYLLLRHWLPADTMALLRVELLRLYAVPYVGNHWLESDELMDFISFGPFGKLAAQLFGRDRVHLLGSVTHFRNNATVSIKKYHYDFRECLEGFPPAGDTARSLVKFWIPLNDELPSFWFVNQSTLAQRIKRVANETAREDFLAGLAPPPKDLCLSGSCKRTLPPLGRSFLDRASLRPMMRLGDVLVHSTTLPHRTSPENGGGVTGWLTLTFGVPETRFVPLDTERLNCDTGVDARNVTRIPRLFDVPHPSCYPRVFPPPLQRGQVMEQSFCVLDVGNRISARRFRRQSGFIALVRSSGFCMWTPSHMEEDAMPESNIVLRSRSMVWYRNLLADPFAGDKRRRCS